MLVTSFHMLIKVQIHPRYSCRVAPEVNVTYVQSQEPGNVYYIKNIFTVHLHQVKFLQ